MITALRGMKDILPPQNKKFVYILQNLTAIARKYGFEFIQTPILEETSLFIRSVGESSDIVGKEMYRFRDKGGNDICLRPEATAGVVRAFIEKKYDKQGAIQRFYYYGPMFRYERPQKGRFRQFHQFGAESFGVKSHFEDANIILMIKEMLDFFKIEYTLKLNSLGCGECIVPYKNTLVMFLEQNKDFLCEDCIRRKDTNPIRVFDCKNQKCQEILKPAPRLDSNLCEDCDTHFKSLLKLLDAKDIDYELDPNLVRGLDYYNKSAFEFISGDLGAQNAVAGGGRYDKLVSFLGGKETPAIGFAIGIERLMEMVKDPSFQREGYYFGALCEEGLTPLFLEASKQRSDDKTTLSYDVKSLKAHLKAADKANARYCAIIGEDELAKNEIWIKDLVDKNEEKRAIG